jgi:hypothetical protein
MLNVYIIMMSTVNNKNRHEVRVVYTLICVAEKIACTLARLDLHCTSAKPHFQRFSFEPTGPTGALAYQLI